MNCFYCNILATKRITRGVRVCQQHFEQFHNLQVEQRKKQRAKARLDKFSKHPYLRRAIAKYNITMEQYLALLEQQRGHCPICWRRFGIPKGGKKRGGVLVVDHDHKTGKVRGLLCGKCNTMLGLAGDEAMRLRRAACYLDGLTEHWKNDILTPSVDVHTNPPLVM